MSAERGIRPRRVHVIITACDRPRHLALLLSDIAREAISAPGGISVAVYDDASKAPQTEAKRICAWNKWAFITSPERHGKQGFHKWMSRVFADQESATADIFIMLPDDVRLCRRFFARATALWGSIKDRKKIGLNLFVHASRDGTSCWTDVKPKDHGDFVEVGWLDGLFICEKILFQRMRFQVPPVRQDRWERDNRLGSGVGRSISMMLSSLQRKMYQSKQSLVVHTGFDSLMNPQERARNPLRTLRFIDGDAECKRLEAEL